MSLRNVTLGAMLAAMLVAWTAYGVAGESIVRRMYDGRFQSFFIVPAAIHEEHTPQELHQWLGRALVFASVAGCAFCGAILAAGTIRVTSSSVESLLWLCGCSAFCFMLLLWQGYDSDWYRIEHAMSFTVDPPYRHRVLFVLVARAIQALAPGLSDLKCFYLSQGIAIVAAMVAIRKWVELFVRRDLAFLSQVLLAVMLVPTFTYFTFYDVGIVLFYTLGLTLLFRRKLPAYFGLIGLATLNHEVVLFLICVSAVLYYERRPTMKWTMFVGGQLAIYVAIRSFLFYLMPVSEAWTAGNFWINIEYVLFNRRDLSSTGVLFLWFAIAGCLATEGVSPALKRCMILFPLLLGMTIAVGQLNEARLFEAFIPIAIALILSGLDARVGRLIGSDSASESPHRPKNWSPSGGFT